MTAPFNPYAHLHAASIGDIEALRLLARKGAEVAAENGDDLGMHEALVFARLAYARANDKQDAGLLISLLALAQTIALSQFQVDSLQSEAIALASLLADAGDETAETWLGPLVENSTSNAAGEAAAIRKLMMERVG